MPLLDKLRLESEDASLRKASASFVRSSMVSFASEPDEGSREVSGDERSESESSESMALEEFIRVEKEGVLGGNVVE